MKWMRWLWSLTAVALLSLLLVRAGGPAPREQRPIWIFYDTTITSAHAVQQAIVARGGRVRYASRWLHAVSAELDGKRAHSIPGALHVQPVARMYAARAERMIVPPPLQQQDSASYGPNFGALREMGVPQLHALNFTANNIRIGIIDTGFQPAHEVFTGNAALGVAPVRIIAQKDFINNDFDVRNQPGDAPSARDQELHGTAVWSVIAGNKSGQIIGPAYDAEYVLAKVDVEQVGKDLAADEDRWFAAVEWADSNRVRIISSSLAYRGFVDKADYSNQDMNGDVAVSTKMADEAARRGILVVNSVGNVTNAGPTSLMAPADADSILAVGAINSLGQVASFSARGPTADPVACPPRCKPELVARGVNIWVARPPGTNTYEFQSGTSFATPFVAGGAALFMQQWPNLSVMAVRQALLDAGNNAAFPDNTRGWGVPYVAGAVLFPNGLKAGNVSGIEIATNTLTTLAPGFSWTADLVHPTLRPLVSYRLQLATDNQMANVISEDSVTNNFSLTLRRPLPPTRAIFWRVTAVAATFGISRSTAVTGPITMPDWVTLLVLNDPGGSTTSTTRPQFRWSSLAAPPPVGPLTYEVQILSQSGQIVQTLRNLSVNSAVPPDPLTPNLSYKWRVIARAQSGMADTVDSRGLFVVNTAEKPPITALYPGFPNPFPRSDINDGTVRFWFDLTEATDVVLTIHDLRGRLVKRLIPAHSSCPAQHLDPGAYGRGGTNEDDACRVAGWDGTNDSGQKVPRGVYIARLIANGRTSTQRILYLPQ